MIGDWQQPLLLIAGFAASAFALVRLMLLQQRALTDRFLGFLEDSIRKQATSLDRLRDALQRLNEDVRENSRLIAMLRERLDRLDAEVEVRVEQ